MLSQNHNSTGEVGNASQASAVSRSVASLSGREALGSQESLDLSASVRSSQAIEPPAFGHVPRDTIIQSFPPRIAVCPSQDVEELVRLKGVFGGLAGLLRPFGEIVQGKVVVRDSVGASRSWNDFGVQFVPYGTDAFRSSSVNLDGQGSWAEGDPSRSDSLRGLETPSLATKQLDQAVQHYCRQLESFLEENTKSSQDTLPKPSLEDQQTPTYLTKLLQMLLAGRQMVPFETFTHPVTCVIAVSSQNPSPIEALRELYNETTPESRRLPSWIGGDFLRYYVLVHDEDNDDIAKSTALFTQMKRHFGLHCHLLRLRSSNCTLEDPESVSLPTCRRLSVEEELLQMQQMEQDPEMKDYQQTIYESDVLAVRTFVRELVTQSVVPFMEGRITTWNDQVASRRRGISGRFMSLSKRLTGFGSSRSSRSGTSSPKVGSNYDSTEGFYDPSSSEAIMHRLADYAFMLRDFRLAAAIYDILRADFGDDKAWSHYAIVNEMMAASLLLQPSNNALLKIEIINQSIETALFSYISRCETPQAAVRCLFIITELYRNRGNLALEESARWAERLLQLPEMTNLLQSIVSERLSSTYQFQTGSGKMFLGSRNRKAATWHVMASSTWAILSYPHFAGLSLGEARKLYHDLPPFPSMDPHWKELHQTIAELYRDRGQSLSTKAANELAVDEEREVLDTAPAGRERSLSSALPHGVAPMELAEKLSPQIQENDGFD